MLINLALVYKDWTTRLARLWWDRDTGFPVLRHRWTDPVLPHSRTGICIILTSDNRNFSLSVSGLVFISRTLLYASQKLQFFSISLSDTLSLILTFRLHVPDAVPSAITYWYIMINTQKNLFLFLCLSLFLFLSLSLSPSLSLSLFLTLSLYVSLFPSLSFSFSVSLSLSLSLSPTDGQIGPKKQLPCIAKQVKWLGEKAVVSPSSNIDWK